MIVSTAYKTHRAVRFLYFHALLRNAASAKRLALSPVPARHVRPHSKHKGLWLTELGVDVHQYDNLFLVEHYWQALSLKGHVAGIWSRDKSGALLYNAPTMRARVDSGDELHILHELMIARDYDVRSTEPIVVWDIGMNVGLSALFLAATTGAPVVGYELVPSNFDRAIYNIALNPSLAKQITPMNVGIGKSTRKELAIFYPLARGKSGLFTAPEEQLGMIRGKNVEVSLIAAPEALADVRRRYPGREVVAKIDCEGAEYEIIDALALTGALRLLKVAIIEWHRLAPEHDPERLTDAFSSAGFTVFAQGHRAGDLGMLRCVR